MRRIWNKVAVCILASAMLCILQPCVAQPRGHGEAALQHSVKHGGKERFNPKEFRQRFEAHITARAGLTPDEAKRFFPLFHEMKQQQREIGGKIHRATARVNTERLTEADCKRIYREVMALRRRFTEVEQKYYSRFAQVLPAGKLLRVMEAEREFGREMFRKGPKRDRKD